MTERSFTVKALGETVLRECDLDRMQAFYEEVIGLPVPRRFDKEGMVFFRIAEDYGGHTTILALFPDTWPSNMAGHAWSGQAPESTTLHHFALTIPLAEQESAAAGFAARGIPFTLAEHPWVGWRSIYVKDPEGNVVELVSFDPALLDETAG